MSDTFLDELKAWFAAIADGAPHASVRRHVSLLDAGQSVALTQDMDFHPIVATLGGIVLDDPETSNFHLYLRCPALRGGIFYLSHDGDSRLVFPSLDRLLAAAGEAGRRDCALDDLHPPCAPLAANQDALARLIEALLDTNDDDDVSVVLALIPSLALSDFQLLERLAAHDDFFVPEALADAIAKRPAPGLRGLAERCSAHPHSQVAEAGIRALKAVDNALSRPIE